MVHESVLTNAGVCSAHYDEESHRCIVAERLQAFKRRATTCCASPRSVRAATLRSGARSRASLGAGGGGGGGGSRRSSAPGDWSSESGAGALRGGLCAQHVGFGLTHERTDRREALSGLISSCGTVVGPRPRWPAKTARMMAGTICRWPLGTSTNTFRMKCTRQRCRPFSLAAIDLRRACTAYNSCVPLT